MLRQLPNQLTMLRLVFAVLFFCVLNQFRYGIGPSWAIWLAIAIFALAVFTDFLDGFLARRWHVESKFGRIMDPFCDKVLIIGAFIYLAGPRFVNPDSLEQETILANMLPGNMISGVYPWMVCLIVARELLVTGIRGEMETQGHAFGAGIWGKLKMILQSVCIGLVLILVALLPVPTEGKAPQSFQTMRLIIDVSVYLTVFVTVASGIPYIKAAALMMKGRPATGSNEPN